MPHNFIVLLELLLVCMEVSTRNPIQSWNGMRIEEWLTHSSIILTNPI